jgi:hypothetical protein
MYFIQGVFYQNSEGLDVACKPGEGMVAVIRKALYQYTYAGFIWKEKENLMGELVGDMQDYYGLSNLSTIHVSDRQISFIKKYHDRKDWISYVFTKKDGNTWVGQYDGSETGKGVTRCILTEVNEDFFDPLLIMKFLGVERAHAWPQKSVEKNPLRRLYPKGTHPL